MNFDLSRTDQTGPTGRIDRRARRPAHNFQLSVEQDRINNEREERELSSAKDSRQEPNLSECSLLIAVYPHNESPVRLSNSEASFI